MFKFSPILSKVKLPTIKRNQTVGNTFVGDAYTITDVELFLEIQGTWTAAQRQFFETYPYEVPRIYSKIIVPNSVFFERMATYTQGDHGLGENPR